MMSSGAREDDDRNNAVVLEQPHRNAGQSFNLDSVDATAETTTFSDVLRTQKTKIFYNSCHVDDMVMPS
jgi:hypothetical protein